MAKLAAGGGAGVAEATLMLSEKVKAGLELQASLIGQGANLRPLSGTQLALRYYRGKVAANKRRLSR